MSLPVRGSARQPAPFTRSFDDLYSEFDRLVQSVIESPPGDTTWTPRADVIETPDAYVIEAELPGVRREDVDLELNGNELVVSGELKERKREGLLRRKTRRIGRFELRISLPGDLREGGAEASLAYGVLNVYVPKADTATAQKIKVTESNSEAK
jgi:HSP20 family protein